jgi:hypothetical protein
LGTEYEDLARTFGTLFALAAAAVTALSALFLLATNTVWTNLATYAAGFNDLELVPYACWFLLAVLFVPVTASIHTLTPEKLRFLSITGLAFAVMYATTAGVAHGLMLTFVRQRILSGDLTGLEPWIDANPNSAMFKGFDMLAYAFQGLSTLFLAPLFRGGTVMKAIRWLFLANGIIGIAGLVGITFISIGSAAAQAIGVDTTVLWSALLTAALALLAVAFWRRLLMGFHD